MFSIIAKRSFVLNYVVQGPVAETIFFAVGALTLSVLFAVHCGLVTFGVVEEEPQFEML